MQKMRMQIFFFGTQYLLLKSYFSGSEHKIEYKGSAGQIASSFKAMPYQDNKSDQVAYKNCSCGHHYNYHEWCFETLNNYLIYCFLWCIWGSKGPMWEILSIFTKYEDDCDLCSSASIFIMKNFQQCINA